MLSARFRWCVPPPSDMKGMAVTTTLADKNHPAVIGGVDTHKDVHVAAALDHLGRELGTESFPTTPHGYRELLSWLSSFGQVKSVGVEATGSWGAGLSRFLGHIGIDVIEVNCSNRQNRRRKGKSDPTDAIAAAKAVISGEATAEPKSKDGAVESLRMIKTTLRSAVQSRTQAANQIHSIIDTAPSEVREQLRNLSLTNVCKTACRWRPGKTIANPTTATRTALQHLAKRWLALSGEIKELKAQQAELVRLAAPVELTNAFGVGPDTAATLLVAFGDNPERCRSEASFAALCGVSPMDASSGKRQRHRLNKGGDRLANSALWRIVIVRLRHDPETQAYMQRRLAEGKTKREVIRCLKRHVARQVWKTMPPAKPLEEKRPAAA